MQAWAYSVTYRAALAAPLGLRLQRLASERGPARSTRRVAMKESEKMSASASASNESITSIVGHPVKYLPIIAMAPRLYPTWSNSSKVPRLAQHQWVVKFSTFALVGGGTDAQTPPHLAGVNMPVSI